MEKRPGSEKHQNESKTKESAFVNKLAQSSYGMDIRKIGIPAFYAPVPNRFKEGPSAPDAVKTQEQIEAEKDLNKFIKKNIKIIEVNNADLTSLIQSRGVGKWGLLLSPQKESGYVLWYVDYSDEKNDSGKFKVVFFDFLNQELRSVKNCLKSEVVDDFTYPKRKTKKVTAIEKLAILITNSTGININDINDEDSFKGEYVKVPLASLLEKK